MAATRTKAAYANVIGTQKGYRATVKAANGKVLASCHFNVKHTLTNYGAECDRAYAEMKKWLAGFGVS
jgi:hypothetical protein